MNHIKENIGVPILLCQIISVLCQTQFGSRIYGKVIVFFRIIKIIKADFTIFINSTATKNDVETMTKGGLYRKKPDCEKT